MKKIKHLLFSELILSLVMPGCKKEESKLVKGDFSGSSLFAVGISVQIPE